MKRKRKYKQTGETDVHIDRRIKALKPGWRKSKSGAWYFESRKNRSDVHKFL